MAMPPGGKPTRLWLNSTPTPATSFIFIRWRCIRPRRNPTNRPKCDGRHCAIPLRDLLSAVNEQEPRMSTAQIDRLKYFGSLGSHPLFSALPATVVTDLKSQITFARHPLGSIVYRQGEVADGVFLVLAGRMKMFAITPQEKTALLQVAGPGTVLGLAAAVLERPHHTTSQTTESSSVA